MFRGSKILRITSSGSAYSDVHYELGHAAQSAALLQGHTKSSINENVMTNMGGGSYLS